MSALFVHQPPTLPQKIDSREGCFGANRGLHVNAAKRIFIKKHRHLHPLLATLVLNAVQNGAKRKTKSINIHCNGINKTFMRH